VWGKGMEFIFDGRKDEISVFARFVYELKLIAFKD
jgi:hypothetical protein